MNRGQVKDGGIYIFEGRKVKVLRSYNMHDRIALRRFVLEDVETGKELEQRPFVDGLSEATLTDNERAEAELDEYEKQERRVRAFHERFLTACRYEKPTVREWANIVAYEAGKMSGMKTKKV